MARSLDTLPSEIFSSVLAHIPGADLAATTHALICALPRAPIPLSHLFEFVHVRRADQVFALYKRLRKAPLEAAWVKEFSLQTWKVDADLVVGLLRLLKDLRTFALWVGPNFAPEHMEDIMDTPMTHLRTIDFRFRPYVQRATYDQFLKGAYFDSTLSKLALWPTGNVARVSVVQDPYERPPDQQSFAQPIVFFRLDTVSILARSRFARDLPALKLRVPHRPIARNMTAPGVFPSLRVLDLSTTFLPGADLEAFAGRLRTVQALVLDGCSLVRAGAGGEDDWKAIGHVCATGGLRLARERERSLRAWLERQAALEAVSSAAMPAAPSTSANASIASSARARKPPKVRKGGPASLSAAMQGLAVSADAVLAIPKIRILPAYPTLRALATTVPFMDDLPFDVAQALVAGWRDGVRIVHTTRVRLRTSMSHGTRVVRILEHHEREPDVAEEDDKGMDGLKELSRVDDAWAQDELEHPAPVFCLAGPSKQAEHPEGCAHRYAWEVWDE